MVRVQDGAEVVGDGEHGAVLKGAAHHALQFRVRGRVLLRRKKDTPEGAREKLASKKQSKVPTAGHQT